MRKNFKNNKLLTKKCILLSSIVTTLFSIPFFASINEIVKNENYKQLSSIDKELSYIKENSIQKKL